MSAKVVVFTNPMNDSLRRSQQTNATKEVLRELFTLLEEYSPIWYPEDLHNRAAAVLGGPTPIG